MDCASAARMPAVLVWDAASNGGSCIFCWEFTFHAVKRVSLLANSFDGVPGRGDILRWRAGGVLVHTWGANPRATFAGRERFSRGRRPFECGPADGE
jgi:hypothetical protein